jgi:hypothetical protein
VSQDEQKALWMQAYAAVLSTLPPTHIFGSTRDSASIARAHADEAVKQYDEAFPVDPDILTVHVSRTWVAGVHAALESGNPSAAWDQATDLVDLLQLAFDVIVEHPDAGRHMERLLADERGHFERPWLR